jgi:hypothetical protein
MRQAEGGDGLVDRRRVAGFRVVGFRVAVARRFVVVAFGFVLPVAAGLAAGAVGAGVVAAVAMAAAVDFGVARRRGVGFAVDFAAVRVVRLRDGAVGLLSATNPATSAASSRTSAVTSASRTVRFSRFLSEALPSRSRRRASSSRAAARANSSHSRWRATAATGVIAAVSSFAIESPSENRFNDPGQSLIERVGGRL